jgi:hypothetical protein
MHAVIRPAFVALSIACMPVLIAAAPIDAAFAQNAPPAAAAQAPKQIALTEKQITDVLAVKPELEPILSKLPEGGAPDPKVIAQLDGIVKKHGFASYAEYSDVDDNIGLVMGGIDPQTKKYVGDEAVIKGQIAQVQADKKMPPKDKKEALTQLTDSLKSIAPLQFPANVPLVLKYFDKLSEESPQNQ